jgi:hypothetical protein
MSPENPIITSIEDQRPTIPSGSSLATFDLSGNGVDIALSIDGNGNVEHLSYRSARDAREFSGEQIRAAVSDEGTRATVVLDGGVADGPIARFTVFVPTVLAGGERVFQVTAAGLRSTQRSLFGGPRPGPQQSYEAVALTGTVSWAPGTCRGWHASHDHRPPGRKLMTVTGTCTFPTEGYAVKLRRHEPQGISPTDLMLDKVVIAPSGPVAQVISDVKVRYEQVTDHEYDTVTILPGGPSIPVQHVR